MNRSWVSSIALCGALAGCAHRPVDPPAAGPPPSGLAAAVFPEPRPERDGFVPRRRLEHTVTLGQDAFLPGAAPAGRPPSATPLTLQNNVYVIPPPTNYGYGYGYGGYGLPVYSTGTSRSAPVNPVTGTPPVAGDWPAAPSYGPRPMR